MDLKSALNYVTHHAESIIQWLFLAILLLSGYLIARGLMSRKPEETRASSSDAGASASSPEIQAAIEKILAQTAKLEALSLEKLSPEGVASVDAEVQALKAEIASRDAEIAKIREGGGAASEDVSGLNARIQELEAKLSEYEILEDDIADLSLYKEENSRLRTEIERLKGGAAPPRSAEESPEAIEPEPPTIAEPSGEDIVAEFAEAVSVQAESDASSKPLEAPETGDPMSDFESALKLDKTAAEMETEIAAAAPTPKAAPATPAEPAAAPAAKTEQAEADDLFAEFAAESSEPAALDTDKMMEEMAQLVNMEPATGNALEESIDTEKMAMEASDLEKS